MNLANLTDNQAMKWYEAFASLRDNAQQNLSRAGLGRALAEAAVSLLMPVTTMPVITFEVDLATYVESHQTTYHVLVKRSDRDSNAGLTDQTGIVDVFHHSVKDYTEIELEFWREFLRGYHPISHGTWICSWDEIRVNRAIRQAIADYHLALDNREHGGLAANNAFATIQGALDMHWVQGAEKAKRENK